MMRKILVSLMLLVSFYGNAQFTPNASKTQWANGISIGTQSGFNYPDSNVIYWRYDSVLMAKYKGTEFILGSAGSSYATWYRSSLNGGSVNVKINDTLTGFVQWSPLSGATTQNGRGNTFLGYYAGTKNYTSSVSGYHNVFIGGSSGEANDSGYQNTFIGHRAGVSNVGGYENTFVGQGSGFTSNTNENTFMGFHSGLNVSGGYNTIIGSRAAETSGTANASYNTLIGQLSGHDMTTAQENSALGRNSLYSLTTGQYNLALGNNAGFSNMSGTGNTYVGYAAGYTATGANANVTGTNNVHIGYQSGAGVSTQLTNSVSIGYRSLVDTSNAFILGNSSHSIGIRTQKPKNKFQIGNVASYTNNDFAISNGTNDFAVNVDNTATNQYSTNSFIFYPFGSELLRLANSKVMIGGSTDYGAKLNVSGSIYSASDITAVGTVSAATLSGTLSTAAQPNITSVGVLNGLTIVTGSGSNLVNIGAAASGGNSSGINFRNGSTDRWYNYIQNGNTNLLWMYAPNSTSIMSLTSAGTLSVNNATFSSGTVYVNSSSTIPSVSNGKLIVKSSSADFVIGIQGNTTTGSSYGPMIQAGSNSSDISFLLRDVNNANDYFKIRGDGQTSIYNLSGTGSRAVLADASGVLSAPVSDRSVKKNIKPLNFSVSQFMKLKPSSFEYIKGWENYGKGKQIGFIAQEVQEVLPNSTYVTPSTGKMGYNEIDMIPILVDMVQKQQKQIDELKARISKLEKK